MLLLLLGLCTATSTAASQPPSLTAQSAAPATFHIALIEDFGYNPAGEGQFASLMQDLDRAHIAAPIEQVWEAIDHSKEWPFWWDAVASVVELNLQDTNGVNVRRFVWKTLLSYTLSFDTHIAQMRAPVRLEVIANGDVEERGLWELSTTDRGTEVFYTWTVHTTKRWMNALAVVARPLMKWNHNAIMQQGGKGLAQRLQAKS